MAGTVGREWSRTFLLCSIFVSLAVAGRFVDNNGITLRPNPILETTSDQFISDIVRYHNAVRAYHGVNYLKFSKTLQELARLRSLMLAFSVVSAPQIGAHLHLGENVWFQADENVTDAAVPVKSWYLKQFEDWNYSNPGLSDENRNFAQLVWRSTDQIGCGQAYSKRKHRGTYTVCYYNSPVSSQGIAFNVAPPRFPNDDPGTFIEAMAKQLTT